MFGFGMPELIVILFIVMLVFGASRLPELGDAMGKGIKNFKRSVGGNEIDIKANQADDGGQA